MKQTECNCSLCAGKEFFSGFTYKDGHYVYGEEPEEEPKSLWERIGAVSDELKKLGAPAHLINELNDICDQIDSIDSEILRVKERIAKTLPHSNSEIELGEISKKLY
jgi:hypothetical protein